MCVPGAAELALVTLGNIWGALGSVPEARPESRGSRRSLHKLAKLCLPDDPGGGTLARKACRDCAPRSPPQQQDPGGSSGKITGWKGEGGGGRAKASHESGRCPDRATGEVASRVLPGTYGLGLHCAGSQVPLRDRTQTRWVSLSN